MKRGHECSPPLRAGLFPRHIDVARHIIAQGQVCAPRDSDAGRRDRLERRVLVGGHDQRTGGVGQVHPIVPQPGQSQGLGQLARSVRELPRFCHAPTVLAHRFDPLDRLQSADQDRFGNALGRADEVEHHVQAVGEVDVGMARRPEHRAIAWRPPPVRMAGRVIFEVRLGLDDDAGQRLTCRQAVYDDLAEQLLRRRPRVLLVELAREGCYHGDTISDPSSSAGAAVTDSGTAAGGPFFAASSAFSRS